MAFPAAISERDNPFVFQQGAIVVLLYRRLVLERGELWT